MPKHPSAPPGYFFTGQLLHGALLTLLLAAAWLSIDHDALAGRSVLGAEARTWLVAALLVPVLHQASVWLAWRGELCFGTVTEHVRGFGVYRLVFFLLLLARPVVLALLAASDHDSVRLSIPARAILCAVLAVPCAYTGYSVARYFGLARAAGADHFDESYRDLPLVREGIFRFTSNSMYVFGFFALWIIALAAASYAALVVTAFSHAYIWVHYICTERPDMRLIYS